MSALPKGSIKGKLIGIEQVIEFTSPILVDIHNKTAASICGAALGVLHAHSLSIHSIGRGLAFANGLSDKHAIKQVDRLLSNMNFNVESLDSYWVKFLIGERKKIRVTMDWTDFDSDSHSTIYLHLVTNHGRATPLLFKTIEKTNLKNNRNNYEDDLLDRLKKALPEDVEVEIIADRGFCDTNLFEYLTDDLGFNFTIRMKANILLTDEFGETKKAKEWVSKDGRMKSFKDAEITGKGFIAERVAIKHAKGMKEPWIIVSSVEGISAKEMMDRYGKRWGCETQFKDSKDSHFGMGLSETHIKDTTRRDRLLFLNALATALLTLLGAAGEKLGLDKYLKSNTSKKRTISLLRQGSILFSRLPKMALDVSQKLLEIFSDLIVESKNLTQILGMI